MKASSLTARDLLSDEDLEVLSKDPYLMPEEKSTIKQIQDVRQNIRKNQSDIQPLKDEQDKIRAEIQEDKIPASQVRARQTRIEELERQVEQLRGKSHQLTEKNRYYVQVLKRLEQIRQKTTYRTAPTDKVSIVTFPDGEASRPTKTRRGIGITLMLMLATASLAPVLLLGVNPLFLIGTIVGGLFFALITEAETNAITPNPHGHTIFRGIIPKHALELYENVKTSDLFDTIVMLSVPMSSNRLSPSTGTTAILAGVIFSHPNQDIKFKIRPDEYGDPVCKVKDVEVYFFSIAEWKVGKELSSMSS